MRGLLDGHVWLSRRLAERGHFPAIDVLRSISRLMTDITPREYQQAVRVLRQLLSLLQENEDLLSIGAYRKGTNRELDVAVAMKSEIHALLRQAVDSQQTLAEVQAAVQTLAQLCQKHMQVVPAAPTPL